jgi:hypothetical protein
MKRMADLRKPRMASQEFVLAGTHCHNMASVI